MAGNTTTNNTATTERAFSPILRQSVVQWSDDNANGKELSNLSCAAIWRKRLEIIASEASFLGFSRLIQLCKAAKACLDSLGSASPSVETPNVTKANSAKSASLQETWKTIVANVQQPGNNLAERTEDCIRALKVAFELSEQQLKEGITLRAVTRSNNWPCDSSEVDSQSLLTDHVDTNVYCKNVIDALDHCADEESWIVSQLANIAEDFATGVSADRPAHRLMKVLQGHKFFQAVDRVCLAGRVPNANQLVVVDSAVSDRAPKNTLRRGYSCFVNPNGSLFAMQPSTVRVFGECNQVLTSFTRQNKPAQRSIALIAEQGLRSGLCMAIGRGATIQGFLFINSNEPDLFQNVTSRYAPLLSLFGLVATISLDANGFHGESDRLAWPMDQSIPGHSIRFDKDEFAQYLSSNLEHWLGRNVAIEITTKDLTGEFLYLPRTLVQVIGDTVLRMVWNREMLDKPLQISLSRRGDDNYLAFTHHCDLSQQENRVRIERLVDSLNDQVRHMPLAFDIDHDCIRIRFPYEPTIAGPEGQLYSIAH